MIAEFSQPWTNGGEVWVVNNSTGDVEATGLLDASGNFSIVWGIAGLPGIPVDTDATPPQPGEQIEIIIDYTCSITGPLPTCPPPLGVPATTSFIFTQSIVPIMRSTGFIYTGTGPNAIELVDFQVTSQSGGSNWLPFALLIGSLVLVSGAVTVIRKRKA